MSMALLSILSIGFVLGIKHAIEPDHVIAVSTIASRSKKLWQATLAGVFWGIGHTATLFIIGITLILIKSDISDKWSMSLEFLVGIMLVYLGIASILSNKKGTHVHRSFSEEDGSRKSISYYKSLFIGLVHGLAGSAAMILLTMSTVGNMWQGALYMFIFGLGTILGMLLFTTIIGIPFVLSKGRNGMNRSLTLVTGVISTVFGLYYMYNLGFTEGLFSLWIY